MFATTKHFVSLASRQHGCVSMKRLQKLHMEQKRKRSILVFLWMIVVSLSTHSGLGLAWVLHQMVSSAAILQNLLSIFAWLVTSHGTALYSGIIVSCWGDLTHASTPWTQDAPQSPALDTSNRNVCIGLSPEANLRHHGCNLQLYRTFLTEVLVVWLLLAVSSRLPKKT